MYPDNFLCPSSPTNLEHQQSRAEITAFPSICEETDLDPPHPDSDPQTDLPDPVAVAHSDSWGAAKTLVQDFLEMTAGVSEIENSGCGKGIQGRR
jgi:hypothetical protein